MLNKVEPLTSLFLVVVFSAALIFAFVFFVFGRASKPLPQSKLSIGGKTLSVEVAKSSLDRMRGLSGRESLGENEGMIFIFDKAGNYGFWMKDMKFPIDIIWIKSGEIAGFSENAVPELGHSIWSLKLYYPPDRVDEALEVQAGFVEKNKIKVGDAVRLQNL